MSTEDLETKEFNIGLPNLPFGDYEASGEDWNRPLGSLNLTYKRANEDEEEEEEEDSEYFTKMLQALNALKIDKDKKEPTLAEKRMLAAVYDDTTAPDNKKEDRKLEELDETDDLFNPDEYPWTLDQLMAIEQTDKQAMTPGMIARKQRLEANEF